jgi:hypothetical protein
MVSVKNLVIATLVIVIAFICFYFYRSIMKTDTTMTTATTTRTLGAMNTPTTLATMLATMRAPHTGLDGAASNMGQIVQIQVTDANLSTPATMLASTRATHTGLDEAASNVGPNAQVQVTDVWELGEDSIPMEKSPKNSGQPPFVRAIPATTAAAYPHASAPQNPCWQG